MRVFVVAFSPLDPNGRVFDGWNKYWEYQRKVLKEDIATPIQQVDFAIITDKRKEGLWSPTALVRDVEARRGITTGESDEPLGKKDSTKAWKLIEDRLRERNIITKDMNRYRSQSNKIIWRNSNILVTGLVINTLSVIALLILLENAVWVGYRSTSKREKTNTKSSK